ncbi:hypothetical protein GOBAR_AA14738 [Gossypium barbadense]|uniref:Uncharacterized protein n=1 Tax=Gossypium barbadense TaxID=3634 RepID=A0A2P5XRD1_GOSBA|nr:hypothetical protein GOBAR_AA14738 [Gossypium barbadense]
MTSPFPQGRIICVTRRRTASYFSCMFWKRASTFLYTFSFVFSSMITASLLANFSVSPGGLPWCISSTTTSEGTWPHDSYDPFGMTLTGRLREPANYYYHYYGGNQGSEGSSSDTDSGNISYELNEAMDIDALISGGRKRHKTLTEATPVNLSSEDEGGGPQLEHRQRRRNDSRVPATVFTPIRSSPPMNLPTVGQTSLPITITGDNSLSPAREDFLVALIVEKVSVEVEHFPLSLHCLMSDTGTLGPRYTETHDKELADTHGELHRVRELYNKHLAIMKTNVEECEVELAVKKERCIIAEVKMKKFNTRHSSKVEGIIMECQEFKENLLLHTQVAYGPFDVRQVDFDALADVVASNLGFDGFNHSCSLELLIRIKVEGDDVTEELYSRSFALASCARGRGFLPGVLNFTVGSFALANCVRGHGTSPANLSFTDGSFALTNYVAGRGSSPIDLNFTIESFALANCAGGYTSLPVNLNFTVGNFALATYAGGCASSPATLNFIARRFALVSCAGGRGSSPANLNFTTGSFALANCTEGRNSSPVNLNFTAIAPAELVKHGNSIEHHKIGKYDLNLSKHSLLWW